MIYFRPFSFSILYDKDKLFAVEGVTEGTDLKNNGEAQTLLARQNDPPGEVLVIGVPNRKNVRGDNLHLFSVKFQIKSGATGRVALTGKVNKFVEADIITAVTDIGIPGRDFQAGNIYFDISNKRQRRVAVTRDTTSRVIVTNYPMLPSQSSLDSTIGDVHTNTISARSRRDSTCSTGRDLGDTNDDCQFDVVDSAYTAEYVVEALVNFTGTRGNDFKNNLPSKAALKNMDADVNTVINSFDSFYLARAAVGMTRFLNYVRVVPAVENTGLEDNGCITTLEAQVLMAGNKPDSSASDKHQTLVFFDLASGNKSLTKLFADSVDDCKLCQGTLRKDVSHVGKGKM
eukprot:m.36341 g.36341  ORF g.36341 m.36341 type:complete len:344 (-) comp9093_c0_seq1:219-1250(-)